jgi:hypothetical protein
MSRWSSIRRFAATAEARVFGAILVVWLILFFSYKTEHTTGHPADGEYHAIRARGDGHYYYLYTLSLVLDRDLSLENQLRTLGDPFGALKQRGPTGRPYIRPVGSSIMQIPAFLLGHGIASVANLFGAGIARHGYTPLHQDVTFLGNLLAGFFGLVFAYRLARRHVSRVAALYGALLIGLGSGVVFYSCFWVSYNHTWSIFWAAWLFDYWDRTRGRTDLRRWAALGALLGCVSLVRQQDAIYAVAPIIEGLILLGRRLGKRDLRGALLIAANGVVAGIIAFVIVFPQLYVRKVFFGGYFTLSQDEGGLRLSSPFFWEVLFSSKAGLFVWAPLTYLAAIGLALVPRKSRLTGLSCLGLFALQIYITGCTWAWYGGWSFGMRRVLSVTGVLVLGMGAVIDRLRALHARYPRLAPHAALALALGPCVAMNIDWSYRGAHGKIRVVSSDTASERYLSTGKSLLGGLSRIMGNPTAWPYNWLWGLHHGVSPERWDRVAGTELLQFYPGNYGRHGFTSQDHIKLEKGLGDLDGGGWAQPAKGESGFLWAKGRARVLVPLHVYDHVGVILSGAAAEGAGDVEVRVNGHRVGPARFGKDWSDVRLEVPEGTWHPGTNEVELRCAVPAGALGCAKIRRLSVVYKAP